jgi:hypothetical protein
MGADQTVHRDPMEHTIYFVSYHKCAGSLETSGSVPPGRTTLTEQRGQQNVSDLPQFESGVTDACAAVRETAGFLLFSDVEHKVWS